MVRDPLEFQRDAAEHFGARGRRGAGQRLDRLRVSRRVADGRVAGERLHEVRRPPVRPADERALDAAMLVAERNLQVEHLLAVALEAEMPRLDDARVDRADGDLVDFLALDAEELRHARQDFLVRLAAPRVAAGAVRAMEPDRLQPRMAFGPHAPLLGDLALEPVRLRAVGRQGGIARRPRRPTAPKAWRPRRPVSTAYRRTPLPCGRPKSETIRAPDCRRGQDRVAELGHADDGQFRQRDRAAVLERAAWNS